jgi:hypothetical protein
MAGVHSRVQLVISTQLLCGDEKQLVGQGRAALEVGGA